GIVATQGRPSVLACIQAVFYPLLTGTLYPVIWFVASCFRQSASPSSGPATRIVHIGVAAEG
ncbi:hypothetical protein, partial [Rhizobium leguminosarum]|uniref:hypothetical protein n=1 Tax=Rhizobium leguminosarum TaxID=384 RepID=UPI003F9D4DD6